MPVKNYRMRAKLNFLVQKIKGHQDISNKFYNYKYQFLYKQKSWAFAEK